MGGGEIGISFTMKMGRERRKEKKRRNWGR